MKFNSELIDFFKRHNLYEKDMFDYFSLHATMIDYKDEDQRPFVGCFYILDKNKKLRNILLLVPYVYDDITMLVSIHEFIHAIMLYKKLNKRIKIGIDKEVLPMLYEKIYINEKNSLQIINYEESLNKRISMSSDKEYVLGLKLRDELMNYYDYDIEKLNKKVKKLVRKYN